MQKSDLGQIFQQTSQTCPKITRLFVRLVGCHHALKYLNTGIYPVVESLPEPASHMGLKHASREKKIIYGNFFDFWADEYIYIKGFQKMNIRP